MQIAALVVDRILGEPKCFHPLVGFGYIAKLIETSLNKPSSQVTKAKAEDGQESLVVDKWKPSANQVRFNGVLAWCLAVIPLVLLCTALLWLIAQVSVFLFYVFSVVILYATLGLKSLKQHADWVANPLKKANAITGELGGAEFAEAKAKVSWMVSRNTENMTQTQIIKACMESVLENGNDAVYGALFWFAIGGAPAALLYRLANTLDASWGYRSERFLHFGFCAAKMDDVLNFFSARICALCYSLSGNTPIAFSSWRRINHWRKTEGRSTASPNAGIVMSSGAGALNCCLGGAVVYHGVAQINPDLGEGTAPKVEDIRRTQRLLNRSIVFFMLIQFALFGLATAWWLVLLA